MNFNYDLTFNAIKLLVVASRLGAFAMAFPFFNSSDIPRRYKVFFVLILSVVLMPVIPAVWISKSQVAQFDLLKLSLIIGGEVILGFTISLVVLLFTGILQYGGFIIDRSVGFVMARMIDPSTNISTTVFSALLSQVFFMVFLIFDGHHEVIRLALSSFETIPPGQFFPGDGVFDSILILSAKIFLVGMRIALPVFATMLMVNIGMGLLARIGQDFPVLMLSLPLRFGIGFIITFTTFPVMIFISRNLMREMLELVAYISGFRF